MMAPLVALHVTATLTVSPVLASATAMKSAVWPVRSVIVWG